MKIESIKLKNFKAFKDVEMKNSAHQSKLIAELSNKIQVLTGELDLNKGILKQTVSDLEKCSEEEKKRKIKELEVEKERQRIRELAIAGTTGIPAPRGHKEIKLDF